MAAMKVDTDQIGSMHSKVLEQMEFLERALADMETSIGDLNATWEGPNHDRFIATFDGYLADMKKLNASLVEYADRVKAAEGLYNRCEDEVGQAI